jgi:hypothetical protein
MSFPDRQQTIKYQKIIRAAPASATSSAGVERCKRGKSRHQGLSQTFPSFEDTAHLADSPSGPSISIIPSGEFGSVTFGYFDNRPGENTVASTPSAFLTGFLARRRRRAWIQARGGARRRTRQYVGGEERNA